MNKETLEQLLIEEKKADVEKFISHLTKLSVEKNKQTGGLKNEWVTKIPDQKLADLFQRVKSEGLVLDGEQVTLQKTGISYGYQAYKNKMLVAYPESKIDLELVYKDDEIAFDKDSGTVKYTHKIANPFAREEKDIIGGYCIIKNKRGDFLITLTKADIEKHRKVSKMDFIWASWFVEMAKKTLIKKACKIHFKDDFKTMEELDNDNYDLDNPLDLEIEIKSKLDSAKDIKELTNLYNTFKGKTKNIPAFNKYITLKKEEIGGQNGI